MPEILLTNAERDQLRAIFDDLSSRVTPSEPPRPYVSVNNADVRMPAEEEPPEPEKQCLADMINSCFRHNTITSSIYHNSVSDQLQYPEKGTDHGEEEARMAIPKEDLKILEKIYHGIYEDSGRKKSRIRQYIKFYKDQIPPTTNFAYQFMRKLNRS